MTWRTVLGGGVGNTNSIPPPPQSYNEEQVLTYLVLPFHYPFFESHSQECHAMQELCLRVSGIAWMSPFVWHHLSQPTKNNSPCLGLGGREAGIRLWLLSTNHWHLDLQTNSWEHFFSDGVFCKFVCKKWFFSFTDHKYTDAPIIASRIFLAATHSQHARLSIIWGHHWRHRSVNF